MTRGDAIEARHCAGPIDATRLDADIVVRRGDLDLHVAVAVQPGEVLAVLGPNGAGKTTLLRAVAGFHPIAAGRITAGAVWDDPVAGCFVPTHRRRIGMVFADLKIFTHLSVRDNVGYGPRAAGAGRRQARALADRLLTEHGLAGLAARRSGELSTGQTQRVALLRALAADPVVLLLDEPLSALDARTRTEVRAALARHLRRFPGPVVLVTHDPMEAMMLADRLVVIEDGRITQSGTPGQIARRPVTDYVARLVGLNLYRGRVGADQRVVLDGGGDLSAAAGPEGAKPAGTPVLVAVAPTAISVHTTAPGPGSARNRWPGVVVELAPVGDRVRVQVDAQPSALVDVTAAAVADLRLAPGSRVWLTAKATEVTAYPAP